MKHVAIVSYFSIGAYDTNTLDENLMLSEILTELQVSHEIVSWSDPAVQWERFSLLLIKSTWDYFDYYPEFLAWIAKIEKLGIPSLNSMETIRWNSSKRYLLEIESAGFPVVAGMILEKGLPISQENIASKVTSKTWVVKPLVSGGAKNTLKIETQEWDNYKDKIQSWVNDEAFLVQPFIPEIEKVGEYSLVFFNSNFSHAVLKTPATKDFRVQHYFGGTIQSVNPSETILASCQKLLNRFATDSLYVRVDGVVVDGIFYLMELEMIEPYLFLGSSEQALSNYKKAIEGRIASTLLK
ncbi:Glutathione synthase/RimK-type ligase, ATP-grasp superfamily [Algoriphagus locisalis]|uniref:Glutathione synthase/RimK-type ligase, ATP-grasp superfamily n=1 Tax=Algoriphagus locisalis TaxID=305507 RepID=A0A1I7DPC7_9BACT|nr:glutathione synthetase [Algoriphagus locisalis]SFU13561.1 Glutathione synthase/RimK-type ligase, ATP-grasp superfamily [Algoriphagus locisalis]